MSGYDDGTEYDLALEVAVERRRRFDLSCSDGFCGATDCATCYSDPPHLLCRDWAEDETNEIEED